MQGAWLSQDRLGEVGHSTALALVCSLWSWPSLGHSSHVYQWDTWWWCTRMHKDCAHKAPSTVHSTWQVLRRCWPLLVPTTGAAQPCRELAMSTHFINHDGTRPWFLGPCPLALPPAKELFIFLPPRAVHTCGSPHLYITVKSFYQVEDLSKTLSYWLDVSKIFTCSIINNSTSRQVLK